MLGEAADCANSPPPLTKPTCCEVEMADFIPIRARGPRKDLTGERFNKLTILRWAGKSHWLCLCDCGKETTVLTANLTRGNTGSCGCVRNSASSLRNTKHGLHRTPAYKTWCGVKRRCLDSKSASYKDYGAKGVTLYEPWINDPAAFVLHVGQPPSDNHTLDRIDNSKGYCPGNLRWATPLEQASNKTNNRFVTYQGERYTVAQLARKIATECGISYARFSHALEKQMYRRKSRNS